MNCVNLFTWQLLRDTLQLTAKRMVVLCTNRRLGSPRNVQLQGEDCFRGVICRGLFDDTKSINWAVEHMLIIGFGAYAMVFVGDLVFL